MSKYKYLTLAEPYLICSWHITEKGAALFLKPS